MTGQREGKEGIFLREGSQQKSKQEEELYVEKEFLWAGSAHGIRNEVQTSEQGCGTGILSGKSVIVWHTERVLR